MVGRVDILEVQDKVAMVSMAITAVMAVAAEEVVDIGVVAEGKAAITKKELADWHRRLRAAAMVAREMKIHITEPRVVAEEVVDRPMYRVRLPTRILRLA
jgi:predicted nucleic acid-binding protein